MKNTPFNPHKIKTARFRKRQKRNILLVFIALIILGSFFFYPRITARWLLWKEEKRLQDIEERLAAVPAEAFPTTVIAMNDAGESFEKTGTEIFYEQLSALAPVEIPAEKILAVPFICQNPFQDTKGWEIHKESCEEAALLQAYLYLSGETVSVEEADRIFRDMISWQQEPTHFGGHIDLYGEDMKRFIEEYYSLSSDQVVHLQNLNQETIQKVITLGYPLIVPIKGELLRNPFYPYPGYHMLTVIGYSGDEVITNDVGTKRGEKYPYAWERLLEANRPVGNDAFVILKIEN